METTQTDSDVIAPVKGAKRAALRKWVLKLTWVFLVLTPLIFVFAALGAKLGLWDWTFGLGVLTRKVGPAALLMTGVFGLISLLLAIIFQPRKGFVTAGLALVIAVAGFGKLGATASKVAKLPYIHDVTTNTQDVPTFSNAILEARKNTKGVNSVDYAGKRDSRDNELVSVLQTQDYSDIRPLILSEDPKVIFGKAEAIASGFGWDIVTRDVEGGIIEATDTTFWYGFKDDIVMRLRGSEGGGTIIDVRSLSRVGQSDLGKNAARIRAFLEKLKEA